MRATVASTMRALADMNTEAGSVEWSATSESATSPTPGASAARARRWRTPIRARRSPSVICLRAFTELLCHTPPVRLFASVGPARVHRFRASSREDRAMGKLRGKRRAQRRQARRPEQGGGRPRGRGAPAAGGGASFDARAVGEVIDAAVAACFPHARAGPAGALVVALARGPSHPEGLALVDRALGRSLVDAVTAAWGRGWQPADLHRMVERTHGRAHARLSAVALGCEARGYADESVPVRWRQQLDAVGAEPPPEGDHRWAVPVAAARAGALWSGVPSIDDRADAVQVAVETLALIRGLPALPKLGPAPGEATVGHGRGRPPHS